MRRFLTLLCCAAATLVVPQSRAVGQGAISGVIYDSLKLRGPLRDVSVMLTELNRVTTADARGRFKFDSVPDGQYHVTFFYSALDSLGIGGPIATITVSNGRPAEAYLTTPSPAELYRRLCGPPKDPSVAAVLGHVRDVDTGQPIADANVETFWAEFEYVSRNFRRRTFKAITRSGPQGAFILCGVPADVPLDITVRSGVFEAGPVTVTHGRDVVARRDIAVSRRDSAARADTMRLVRDSTHIPIGSGVVRGTLRDRNGKTVADAPVRIVADARETRSGPDGKFVLTGVPAGTRTVEARAIGYGPATNEVDVPTGGTANADILFDRRAQELKAITVVGQRPRRDIEGFAVRQREGLGKYVTDDDLKRRPVSRVGDAILRSGNVTYDLTSVGPELKMRATGSMTNDSRCIPNFFLDGMLIPAPEQGMRQTMLQAIEAMVNPEDVRGIEIYGGLGGIPPEFNRNNGCGTIVIWTR
ncbi:MAG: carboxypeptidase regulatory-like domain-containing protein [Gemmatimonadetes bacterium]|nr:carboxypeptidase regulatory-like domain-containing protein [Gemmatimonadota bacterium]